MANEEIPSLLEQGQNHSRIWLETLTTPLPVSECLVALANGQGGAILIGIQNGEVNGIENAEAVVDSLIQITLGITPPLLIPLPQIIGVPAIAPNSPARHLIKVVVPAGMPHIYATADGRYLRREGCENIALLPKELMRLMLERSDSSFETEIPQGAQKSDLDWQKVAQYAKLLGSANETDLEQLLIRRGCLVKREETLLPTHAGMLLFGKDPQRFIPNSDIVAVRFAGETMTDTFSRQDISGTLPDQIRQAETFLRDTLRKEVTLTEQMARQEVLEYPLEAVRELLINAVAHRNYSIIGDNIKLFLFSNRMEVKSTGGLAGYMTVQNLKDARFSRNPIVVQVLSDMHFIERLGYGVDRVIELMESHGLRQPEFTDDGATFSVTLYNTPIIARVPAPPIENPAEKAGTPPQSESFVLTGRYKGVEVNPRQEVAIAHLLKSETQRITNSELQRMFPDVHNETIRRDLVDLVNKRILVQLGKKRGSYYVLRQEGKSYEEEKNA